MSGKFREMNVTEANLYQLSSMNRVQASLTSVDEFCSTSGRFVSVTFLKTFHAQSVSTFSSV